MYTKSYRGTYIVQTHLDTWEHMCTLTVQSHWYSEHVECINMLQNYSVKQTFLVIQVSHTGDRKR